MDIKDYAHFIAKSINDIEESDIISDHIENEWIDREKLADLLKQGYFIYEGSFDDEGELPEKILCESGFKITDFQGEIIENEPGY